MKKLGLCSFEKRRLKKDKMCDQKKDHTQKIYFFIITEGSTKDNGFILQECKSQLNIIKYSLKKELFDNGTVIEISGGLPVRECIEASNRL